MTFQSTVCDLGEFELPSFSNTRVMMMPFYWHDPQGSLPSCLQKWKALVQKLCSLFSDEQGTGYLTIDEAHVLPGECHRRPGLHVDGIREGGAAGSWAGNPGGWAGKGGMILLASHAGCRAWNGVFQGQPGSNGDCKHLRDQAVDEAAQVLHGNRAYWCGALTVHESLPQPEAVSRQFLRLSFPSDAPWYEGYTENPLGIAPGGPVLAPRRQFMNYRS